MVSKIFDLISIGLRFLAARRAHQNSSTEFEHSAPNQPIFAEFFIPGHTEHTGYRKWMRTGFLHALRSENQLFAAQCFLRDNKIQGLLTVF